jgi:hypothetical protein
VTTTSYRGLVSGRTDRYARLRRFARESAARTVRTISATGRASLSSLSDHGLSLCAMGLIDSACFVHSLFTGLLVTGILLFLFEMKIGD